MTDYTVGNTAYFMFTTRKFSTGAPIVLAGSPVISAYENEGLTQITAGVTLGVDHDGVVGLNLVTVVASGANGFEAGKDYHLVITTGTADSVSVVGEVVGRFTLQRSALADGAITAAVIATGAIDADAIAADAITAAKVADGTIDAATLATGTITAAKFAAGAIDAAAIANGAIDAATFAAGAIDAASIATDAIAATKIATGAITAAKFAAGAIDAAAIANGAIDAATFAAGAIDAAALAADAGTEIGTAVWATTTRALTILDEDSTTLDLDATIRAAVGLASANLDTQLAAIDDLLDTELPALTTAVDALPTNAELATALGTADDAVLAQIALVKAQTDLLPSDPADASVIAGRFDTLDTSIADLPTNAELATSQAAADDATLAAIAALNNPSAAVIADAVWDEDATGHQTGGTFGQAIGDPVADTNTIYGAVVTGAAGATVAADVIAVNTLVLDLPTNAELATALGTADDATLAAIDALPTNAELATALGTADDAVLAQIALVKAQTDLIPSDPADASVVAGLIAGLDTKLDTIDDFLDTEIAAVKAKTDNLPSDPADASVIAGRFDTLDTSVADLPTNAELATSQAAADDAMLAALAALTIPTAIQNADALLDRNMATGADNGSTTVRTVRQALRLNRNKVEIAGGTMTVCKEDDATISWTSAVVTDAAAEPITSSDPAGP